MKGKITWSAVTAGKLLLWLGLGVLAVGILLLCLIGTPVTVWLSVGGLVCAVTGGVLRTTNFD